MTNILLINPSTRYLGTLLTILPPLGILYISSKLIEAGFDVEVLDADIDNMSLSDIQQKILKYDPDYIGLTMNTLQSKSAFNTAEFIKKISDINIIVGGPHPSALKGDILKRSGSIDEVVYGEGEITFLELIKALESGLDLHEVDGICFRDGQDVVINRPRDPIENLDSLPRPSIHLLDPIGRYPGAYPVGGRPTIQVMASRGCPFDCIFCSNPVWDKKLRFRSPKSVVDEIIWLHEEFKVREIFFQDDTLNIKRGWIESLLREIIKRGINESIRFKCSFRANENLLDMDLLRLAKDAGVWMIFYGVESGNQEILDSVKKNLKLEEIKRAFMLTKQAGIKTYASFMIGNLGENRSTVEDTIEFAKNIDPDYYGFAVATPYPGSRFYDAAREKGYLRADFDDYDMKTYILNIGELSHNDVEALVRQAYDSMENYKKSSIDNRKDLLVKNDNIDRLIPQYDHFPAFKCPDEDLLSSKIVMGTSDWDVLGPGWHGLERWPSSVRWTGKKATAYLKSPGGIAHLYIDLSTTMVGSDLTVYINGKISATHKLYKSSNEIIKIPILPDAGAIEVGLEVEETWTPDRIVMNGDMRELGVAVSRIWVEVLKQDYVPALICPDEDLLSGEIIMGETDKDSMGPGWHDLERWPTPVRWTGKKATAYLKSPGWTSYLCADISTTMAGADLAVSVNEVKLGEYKLDPASNEVVKIPLSAGDGVFKVELMVNETWTPDEFKGNGDLRKLGVAVSKIWVEVLERDYVPALTYPEIDLVGGEIVMGTSDRGVLGPGWHVLERWPMPMRWTGKKATAYIKSPDRSSHLCIDVSTTVVGSDLTIFINDNPVKTYKLVPSSNEIVKIPLSIDEGVVKVDLEVDKTWTPDGLDGKGDRRELGVAVSRIWVEKSNLTDLTAIFKSIRKDKPSP